ncbi:MAG: hypothetical protein JWQ09_5093 [Segetibacter sp.]|nr:hypothetical protein [Segetibacter sp.]
MSNNQNRNASNTQPNPANTGKGSRPDVRDNLDSRKNEEQEFKGDDVTHNEKDNKEDKSKKKK